MKVGVFRKLPLHLVFSKVYEKEKKLLCRALYPALDLF